MARIGHVPEIIAVKERLEELKTSNIVEDWELPYENLLTRVTAAIFFVDARDEDRIGEVWEALGDFPDLRYRENEEGKLSKMKWRIEFNKGEGGF